MALATSSGKENLKLSRNFTIHGPFMYRNNLTITWTFRCRYAAVRLTARRPDRGAVRPVSHGQDHSVVFVSSHHVTGQHVPVGAGLGSARRVCGTHENPGLHWRRHRFVAPGTRGRSVGGQVRVPRERGL